MNSHKHTPQDEIPWQQYARLSGEETLKSLQTRSEGLTSAEAVQRMAHYGKNKLPTQHTPWWHFLLRQYTGFFSYTLLAIALFYTLTGGTTEALLVGTIYIINGLLAFTQEYRSDKAMQLLAHYLEHTASVIRTSNEIIIPMSQVVPGDIVIVRAGDSLPADVRIIKLHQTLVDESIMTGESLPVEKTTQVLASLPATMPEATCIAYGGTQVVQGFLTGVVIATGTYTALGAMSLRAQATVRTSTFTEEMPHITHFIGLLLLVSLTIILMVNLVTHGFSSANFWHLLILTIALVVSTIPEALPLVITYALAQGAVLLARHGSVIVKRLSAIEDLGHMQILCCDKTGTLTEHQLSIAQIFSHNPDELLLLARLAGAPLSLKSANLHGFDKPIHEHLTPKLLRELAHYTRIEELPFDPATQTSGAILQKDSNTWSITLGVPEKIIAATPSLSASQRTQMLHDVQAAGVRGERVIGVARTAVKNHATHTVRHHASYDELLGVITFHDPLKKTAPTALEKARKLNVAIKVISGDSVEICGHIAYTLGLINDPRHVLHGDSWEKFTEQERMHAVAEHQIFARCTPQQKAGIVEALKKTGASVGYMGDGVNDMLPLKAANVAIAVQHSPDIVRESADIILVHKSLLNVINAIGAGRTMVYNILTYLRITLAASFSNFYSMSFASLFITLPDIFPLHMLIVNLLSDIPLIAIATDHVDIHSLAQPRRFNRTDMLRSTILLGILNSCMDALFLLCFYRTTAGTLETSWALWSTLSELGIIFSLRTTLSAFRAIRPSWQLITLCSSAAIIALTLPLTRFGTEHVGYTLLTPSNVGTIIGLVGIYFVVSELIKPYILRQNTTTS